MKVRQKGLCDEGEVKNGLCNGREVKNGLCNGREVKNGLCNGREVKNGLCNGREGVPTTNLPPPKRVFSPTPPSLENWKRVFTSNQKTV